MQQTCGELFLALWHAAEDTCLFQHAPDVAFAQYAFGFQVGQGEKVASGACAAFMVRPASDWRDWARMSMQLVCAHYGLQMYEDGLRGELWGCMNEEALESLRFLTRSTPENSPFWHAARAKLCGIAPGKIDTAYHERAAHGQRCEPEAS